MKKRIVGLVLAVISMAAIGAEQNLVMRCEKINGENWCAVPQKQIDALIKNNNRATIDLEKLRSNCAKSNFNHAVMPALPINKNKKSAAQF